MRYVLILLVMMFANVAEAIDCHEHPDCANLGYSTEDDSFCAANGYIYCPFDEAYKRCVIKDCAKLGFTESDKTSWCSEIIKCKGNKKMTLCNCLKPRCNIGDVLYADNSCGDVKDYAADKIAVGVVYATNCTGGGKAINLKDLTANNNYLFEPAKPYTNTRSTFYFGLSQTNIPDLQNYWSQEMLSNALKSHSAGLFDGFENTQILLKSVSANPACKTYTSASAEYNQYCAPTVALAAHQFYPPEVHQNNSIFGAGKWYVPSIAELEELFGRSFDKDESPEGYNKPLIDATLKALKEKGIADPLTSAWYWSSSECTKESMWALHWNDGKVIGYTRIDDHTRLRLSISF